MCTYIPVLRAVTPHAGELFVALTGLADPSQWFARNPEAKSGVYSNQSRALSNAGEIEGLMHNPSMFLMLSSRHEKGQHITDPPEQLTPEWPDPTWNRLCVDIDAY